MLDSSFLHRGSSSGRNHFYITVVILVELEVPLAVRRRRKVLTASDLPKRFGEISHDVCIEERVVSDVSGKITANLSRGEGADEARMIEPFFSPPSQQGIGIA